MERIREKDFIELFFFLAFLIFLKLHQMTTLSVNHEYASW